MFHRLIQITTLLLVVASSLWLGSVVGRQCASGVFSVVRGSDLTPSQRAAIELHEHFGESARLPDGYRSATRGGAILGAGLIVAAWTAAGIRRLRRRPADGR